LGALLIGRYRLGASNSTGVLFDVLVGAMGNSLSLPVVEEYATTYPRSAAVAGIAVILAFMSPRFVRTIFYTFSLVACVAGGAIVYEAYKVIRNAKEDAKRVAEKEKEKADAEKAWKDTRLRLEKEARRSGRGRIASPGMFLNKVCRLPAVVAHELGEIVELFVRDFILNWFQNVGTDTSFIDDIRLMTMWAMVEISRRASGVNVPVFLATDGGDVLRHHIMWYKEMSRRVASKHAPRTIMGSVNDSFYTDRNRLVEAAFRHEGRMHPACESAVTEAKYLRHVSNELLSRILPANDYNCAMVRHLLRECIAMTILQPIGESVADPDFLNWAIELVFDKYSADATEPEQDDAGASKPGEGGSNGDADTGVVGQLDAESSRYFAGSMSTKMAEKYLKSMPASTFFIRRRDKWSKTAFVVSSVGYATAYQKRRIKKHEPARSRATSMPGFALSLSPKLRVMHWMVHQQKDGSFELIETELSGSNSATAEKTVIAGKSMAEVLKQMKTYFVIGLRFVDGEIPKPEYAPWSLKKHLDAASLPNPAMVFVKQKDSPMFDASTAPSNDIAKASSDILPEAMYNKIMSDGVAAGERDLVSFDGSYEARRKSCMTEMQVEAAFGDPLTYSLSQRQMLQRKNLLSDVERALQSTQAEYSSADRMSDRLERFDESVRIVIDALESVLSYGLKQEDRKLVGESSVKHGYWAYVSEVSKLLNDAELIVTMIDSMPSISVVAEEAFWERPEPEKEASSGALEGSSDEVPDDAPAVDVYQNSLGKGRVFLLVGLNKSFLASYVSALVSNEAIGKSFYEEHSIIRSPKAARYFVALLETLGTVEYNINIDDAWVRKKSPTPEEDDLESDDEEPSASETKNRTTRRRLTDGTKQFAEGTKRKVSAKVEEMKKQLMSLNLFGAGAKRRDRKKVASLKDLKSKSSRTIGVEQRPELTSRASSTQRSFSFVDTSAPRAFDAGDILGFSSNDAVKPSKQRPVDTKALGNSSLDAPAKSDNGPLAGKESGDAVNSPKGAENTEAGEDKLVPLKSEVGGNDEGGDYETPPAANRRNHRKRSVWIGPNGLGKNTKPRADSASPTPTSEKHAKASIDVSSLKGPFVLLLRAEVTEAIIKLKEKSGSIFQNNQPHVEYHINVQSTVTAGGKEWRNDWDITRRYRLFFQLHRALKKECKLRVSLPPKQMNIFGSGKYEKSFLESRRSALNTYLHELLAHPRATCSEFLLAFLEVPSNVSHWRKVWAKMKDKDDMVPATRNKPVSRSGTANGAHTSEKRAGAPSAPDGNDGGVGSPIISDNVNSREDQVNKANGRPLPTKDQQRKDSSLATGILKAPRRSSSDDKRNNPAHRKSTSQVATILEMEQVEHQVYALAREIFETDDLSVLRRNFFVMLKGVLSVTMKGSAYSVVNDAFSHLAETPKIGRTLNILKEYLWPNGEWGEAVPERTADEMKQSRDSSRKMLLEAIPESLIKIFSKEKCLEGVQTLHDFMQCKILVKNLFFTLLDMMLLRLFDDINVVGLHHLQRDD
jgi:hypothetical protein